MIRHSCALSGTVLLKSDGIEAVAAVVRCQSHTLFRLLDTTQPAVTRRIQSLEKVFGVELLQANQKINAQYQVPQ
ncbi:helix-turn-helix domain-containing protein [Burkholderia sp. PAMC 28687]|uniref:helix-turn-helix domain-containing protein n=1 Tax=Burkholderia sp. PAMC 28687 TaxID=1795874 RepID=UPI001E5E6B4B|nr:LysR family transcriptional regulator [Burkholderia sp. PAMC 28687]